MTEEELYTALGKEASDFKRGEEKEAYEVIRLSCDDEFLGKTCSVFYNFIKIPNADLMSLARVETIYTLDNISFEDFVNEVETLLQSQNADYSIKTNTFENSSEIGVYTFLSKKYMIDLPQEIKDGHNNYWYHLYETGYIEPKGSATKESCMKVDYTKTLNLPLSTITLLYYPEENSCKVAFDGEGITTSFKFAEAYAQLNN